MLENANASVEQFRFIDLDEEPSLMDGPLERAYQDAREQEAQQLASEIEPHSQEEISLLVAQRGIYLNQVVRQRAMQGDYDLAA